MKEKGGIGEKAPPGHTTNTTGCAHIFVTHPQDAAWEDRIKDPYQGWEKHWQVGEPAQQDDNKP